MNAADYAQVDAELSAMRMLRNDRAAADAAISALRELAEEATGAGDNISSVPTISRFFGITVAMYFDDHGHPHFHARHADGNAKIRIDEVEVIDSNLGRRQLRLVLAWAEVHQAELLENWRRAQDGETLQEIEPLQ
jgi:hypothetical protein